MIARVGSDRTADRVEAACAYCLRTRVPQYVRVRNGSTRVMNAEVGVSKFPRACVDGGSLEMT